METHYSHFGDFLILVEILLTCQCTPSLILNFPVPPDKPISGDTAFVMGLVESLLLVEAAAILKYYSSFQGEIDKTKAATELASF